MTYLNPQADNTALDTSNHRKRGTSPLEFFTYTCLGFQGGDRKNILSYCFSVFFLIYKALGIHYASEKATPELRKSRGKSGHFEAIASVEVQP